MWKIFIGLCAFFVFSPLSAQTVHRPQADSLLYSQVGSPNQNGYEGILFTIFNRVFINRGQFLILDGASREKMALVDELLNRYWRGTIVEGDRRAFLEAIEKYKEPKTVRCLKEHVIGQYSNGQGGKLLDELIVLYDLGANIDFLDLRLKGGEDYYALASMVARPKVICVNCGPFWHPRFSDEVPYEVMKEHNLGQPLGAMIRLAKEKGYYPLCYSGALFLLREDLAHRFPSIDTSTQRLWNDYWFYSLLDTQKAFHHKRASLPVIQEIEGDVFYKPLF